jgi:exodeoxyribonuclease VII large subunit
MDPALPAAGMGETGALVLRVSEVSGIIMDALDIQALQNIWVRGEITNHKLQPSGHRYFRLSETVHQTMSVISCKMWQSYARTLDFEPRDGLAVLVFGSVEVYEPHGSYNLIVREMRQAGEGEKHLLVERWKRELQAEGLFDPARKRELPRFPSRVGVVTAASGAAFQDICTVIGRRFPVDIVLSPTPVQGEGAHLEIAAAIRRLAGKADVIIVGRGGGSFEDLFPFNHPDVVRAIASSPVPVVSAVGHEVDWVIADLAADRRAPTPSAAAELVVPDRAEILRDLSGMRDRLRTALLKHAVRGREVLEELKLRFHPRRLQRRVDDLHERVADADGRLRGGVLRQVERGRLEFSGLKATLAARNPLALLARGYSILEKDGRAVRSAREIARGDRLRLRMKDGRGLLTVEEVFHDTEV